MLLSVIQYMGVEKKKLLLCMIGWGIYGNWEGAIPFMDLDRFTYAFMEVRGYGKSKGLKGSYTSDEVAGDIFNLADDLSWDSFHLIGHSMTGMAVQKALLLDRDHRIQKLIAITPVSAAGFSSR